MSLVEIGFQDFFAGELGPSTIVGSAAFNLFVITAVCVSAIPAGETRKIVGTGVFCVTATCSLLAYFWLLVILQVNTPNRVDIEEGVLTILMFPLFIFVAFAA